MLTDFIDEYIDKNSDPRVKEYYFGTSIWKPLIVIGAYLIFVKRLGPWYMERRKPYNLKALIMAFDFIQIVANGYMVIQVLLNFPALGENCCMEVDFSNQKHVHLTYYYVLLKISDILDTVFFVLKKNYRQVTYLHVYHHALMIFCSWLFWKLTPGGQTAIIGLLNTTVHTVMYSYYLLSAYDVKYKNDITIKKFVTKMQLGQFLILAFANLYYLLFSSCRYPKILNLLQVIQACYFVYLFGKFYIASYLTPKKEKNQ